MNTLTIGRLANASGVGVETIRFYEREGLLAEPARSAGGYRQYPPATVDRLGFIRRAKRLGFSLGEIRELLALSEGHGDRQAVHAVASAKLAEIGDRIRELQRMGDVLTDLTRQCTGHGPIEGCPIIEALSRETDHD